MRTKVIKINGKKEIFVQYLNSKEAKTYFNSDLWELDSLLTTMCKDSTYLSNKTGSVLIKREDGGTLYESKEDIIRLFSFLSANYKSHPFENNGLPYGDGFIYHIPDVVKSLCYKLSIQQGTLDYSLQSVQLIDTILKSSHINSFQIEDSLMSELVGYFGEIIRIEVNGSWKIKYVESSDANAIEPFIASEEGEYSPVWMVFEEISENEEVSFYNALLSELDKYKLIKKW